MSGLKEHSALVLRAFLLLVDLNDPEYDPDGIQDTEIAVVRVSFPFYSNNSIFLDFE